MANHAFRVPVAAPGFVVSMDPTNAAEPTAGTIAVDTIAEATSAAGVDIDGCLIKDGRAAALATAAMFLSTEQTGTGSAQNVAHGMGVTPTTVVAIPSNLTGGVYVVTYGTHTSTNCVLTVTSGEKFVVMALK